MVTDPPYGVDYEPAWRRRLDPSAKYREGLVTNDDRADWSAAWAHVPSDVAYVWHADIHAALEGFSADDLIGADEAAKYAALKKSVADRSPRELGSLVKTSEVVYHHEVTNQSLWSEF